MIIAKKTLLTWLALTSTLGAVTGQDFFRVNFRAQCTSLDLGRGRQTVEVINNRVLLDQTVGPSRRATHAVVYNPANDSIQVVNIVDGSVVWDVLQFNGGAWSTDGVLSQRLAFAFVPNQSEAVGTVIFKERISSSQPVAELNRVNVTGTLQFVLTGNVVLGGQGRDTGVPAFGNSSRGLLVNVSGLGPALGNVRMCTGTFTVGRRLVPGGENSTGGVTTGGTTRGGPFGTGVGRGGVSTPFGSTANSFANSNTLGNVSTNTISTAGLGGPVLGNQTANVALGQQTVGLGSPTIGIGQPTGTGLGTTLPGTTTRVPGTTGTTVDFTSAGASFLFPTPQR